jgi:hypothetical protein
MKPNYLKISTLPMMIALASCATLSPTNNPLAGNSPQAEQAKHETRMAALKGCGIGAGAGALLGILHGNLRQGIKYAVGGCAVGGAAGAIVEYKKQLDQANALAAEANRAGAKATVSTRQVTTTDKAGQATKVPEWDRSTIQFSPYKTLRHYPSVARVAVKAAKLASASTVPVRIEVDGSNAERQWLLSVMTPYLTNPQTTVSESFATTPGLVLSPTPKIERRPQ